MSDIRTYDFNAFIDEDGDLVLEQCPDQCAGTEKVVIARLMLPALLAAAKLLEGEDAD